MVSVSTRSVHPYTIMWGGLAALQKYIMIYRKKLTSNSLTAAVTSTQPRLRSCRIAHAKTP